jgi:hypothetical protein
VPCLNYKVVFFNIETNNDKNDEWTESPPKCGTTSTENVCVEEQKETQWDLGLVMSVNPNILLIFISLFVKLTAQSI